MEDQQNQPQNQNDNQSSNPGGAPQSTQEKMKEHMSGLEGWLGGLFANAPHIPENGRKVIVEYAPWVVLIFGILGVIGALSLFRAARGLSAISEYMPQSYSMEFMISIAISLLATALLLMSYPGIKAHKKSGWNLVFYSQVVGVAGSVVSVVMGGYYSENLIVSIVVAVVGFWILFEVRSYYTK